MRVCLGIEPIMPTPEDDTLLLSDPNKRWTMLVYFENCLLLGCSLYISVIVYLFEQIYMAIAQQGKQLLVINLFMILCVKS